MNLRIRSHTYCQILLSTTSGQTALKIVGLQPLVSSYWFMATSERKSVEYSVPATDQQNTKQQSQAIVVCLRLQAQTHKTTPINK